MEFEDIVYIVIYVDWGGCFGRGDANIGAARKTLSRRKFRVWVERETHDETVRSVILGNDLYTACNVEFVV